MLGVEEAGVSVCRLCVACFCNVWYARSLRRHSGGVMGGVWIAGWGQITERAVTYNDQSIQENFHLSTTFSSMQANDTINIFKVPTCPLFRSFAASPSFVLFFFCPCCYSETCGWQNLTRNQFLEVRGMVITMVLGTDMTKVRTLHPGPRFQLAAVFTRSRDSSTLICPWVWGGCSTSNMSQSSRPSRKRRLPLRQSTTGASTRWTSWATCVLRSLLPPLWRHAMDAHGTAAIARCTQGDRCSLLSRDQPIWPDAD